MGAYKYTTHQVGLLDMGHKRWICNSVLQQGTLEKARKHEITIKLPKISSSQNSEYITPAPATSAPCNTPEVCYLPPVPGASPATCKSSERTDFKFKYKRYNNRHDTTPAPATSAPCNTPEVCYLPPVPGASHATCKSSERTDFKFKYKRYNNRHDTTPAPAISVPCNTPEVCYLPPVPGASHATCKCSERTDFKFKYKRYNKHDDTWKNNTIVSRVDIGKYLPEDTTQTFEHQNNDDCTAKCCRKKRKNYRKFGIRRDRTELPYLDNGQSSEKSEDVRKCHQNKQEAKCAKVMIIIPCGAAKEDSTEDKGDANTPANMSQDKKTKQSSKTTKLPPIKNSCRKKTLMELPRIPVGEEDLTMSMARQSAVTCPKDETQLESSGSQGYRTDNKTVDDKPLPSLPTISFVHTQNILFTYPS